MRITQTLLTLAGVAAFGMSVHAQDSVSKLNGLPGDALDAYDAAQQLEDYVVDQAILTTSWGTTFGIAPIAKSSEQRNTGPLFFTGSISAQTLSRRLSSSVPFVRSQYSLWNGAGFGVNPNVARNDPGTPLLTTGLTGFQFGFGFAEFGDGNPTGTSLNNMIGGMVNFTPTEPSRLYVARVNAAIGGTNEGCALASVGTGGVDEDGNLDFRADGNTTTNAGCTTFSVFTGNNLFRVRMASRTAMQNVLSGNFPTGADALATDQLLINSAVTHDCPNLIPRSVAGPRSILIGPNFNIQYVFEQVAGSVVADPAGAHLPGLTDHRGSVAYSTRNFPQLFAGTVNGTGAVLGKSATLTDSVSIWGLDANGQFLAPIARTLPATVSDPDQAWSNTLQAGTQQFDHYHGSIAFRGSPSQMALGQDQAGNLLVAGCVYYGTASNLDPNCYIAVAKIDPLTGTTTWTPAAWTRNVAAGYGKNVYQNGATVIGTLKTFGAPGTGTGPTMSAPMIDSVGNVWFVGAFELATAPGTTQVGLMRAVLQPATFSYKIELVLKQGDIFPGRNSGKNYKIDFIALTGSTSISPSAPWSSNVAEVAFKNQSTTGLATSDSATLGGIVIEASIIYDNNGDGQFIKSTGTSGVPGSPDEDYNVLLYIASSADCNHNGIPDDRDIADGTEADSNGDGIPDSCQGIVGLAFCPGDGTGTACPCGNNSPVGQHAGCLNSLGLAGKLTATGNPSISNDTLVLAGTGLPNTSALYFQGTGQQSSGLGQVFGDGLRCASGAVIRLKTQLSAGNASQYPGPGDLSVSVKGGVTSPGVRTYQVWYRNPAPFCTASTFNLSNGLQLSWIP